MTFLNEGVKLNSLGEAKRRTHTQRDIEGLSIFSLFFRHPSYVPHTKFLTKRISPKPEVTQLLHSHHTDMFCWNSSAPLHFLRASLCIFLPTHNSVAHSSFRLLRLFSLVINISHSSCFYFLPSAAWLYHGWGNTVYCILIFSLNQPLS